MAAHTLGLSPLRQNFVEKSCHHLVAAAMHVSVQRPLAVATDCCCYPFRPTLSNSKMGSMFGPILAVDHLGR
eukprot:SAG31_NODE_4600_length_3104_cov_2.174709_4_plen_72_part_00